MKRFALCLLLLLFFSTPAVAEEKILHFDSDIQVFADGSMQVTETIVVHAEQKQIRRGIYRDFPTRYQDRIGNRYQVDFTVMNVARDGRSEAWHSEDKGDDVRVYMGRSNVFLSPGEYTYTLTYQTNRQLGFFTDHDELYWNVTGNDWAFPIDAISARVSLPFDVDSSEMSAEAYTGRRGEQGGDYQYWFDGHDVVFETTRPFHAGEGLTLVATWPKGYVTQPTTSEEFGYFLRDNRTWLIGLVGVTLLFLYQAIAWFMVGRDPNPGVVITRYQPPKGVTPAAARYLVRMGYDHKAFAAALVNLAVQGLIEIREESRREFTLIRQDKKAENLAPGEKAILKKLLGSRPGASLTLKTRNHKKIAAALKVHQAALARDNDKIHFITNRLWLVPGIVGSLVVLGVMLSSLSNPKAFEAGAFMLVWLTIWSVGVFFLGKGAWLAWRRVRSFPQALGAVGASLFFLPFLAGEIAGIVMLATQASSALALLLPTMIVMQMVFHQLIKAPTRAGRRLLDELDGFRLYLDVAEKDEMNLRHPPEKTPELFERFLPYALALDVEQHWAARFAALFDHLDADGGSYHPAWVHGPTLLHGGMAGFADSLGSSLSSAVASSSTAPGSSSGSGGGGSSGGGGGGGGGGGR
nr:DUF2207 domain-containing protein [uncultured Desulfuromonas sp.]